MKTIKQMDMLERMHFQDFLSNTYSFLMRELDYTNAALERVPGDITAMGAQKRIENDIQVIEPLLKNCQRYNMESIEKMTGKQFAYLLENRDVSKDVLKKV